MTSLQSAPFALAPHDVEGLARTFRETGRVRVAGFLRDPGPLARHLHDREDWRQVLNSGEKVFELDRKTRAGFTKERSAALEQAVQDGASYGFQYRFESIRVPDADAERVQRGTLLDRFAQWLSSGDARAFVRSVCGAPAIEFADAQATGFEAGDFLTGHDDDVAGKHRHAAYVFGLTEQWRLEWGGLLMFHRDRDQACEGLVPAYNVLDLFAVPQRHSVSAVTPAARGRRLSVTGWLRSRHD